MCVQLHQISKLSPAFLEHTKYCATRSAGDPANCHAPIVVVDKFHEEHLFTSKLQHVMQYVLNNSLFYCFGAYEIREFHSAKFCNVGSVQESFSKLRNVSK